MTDRRFTDKPDLDPTAVWQLPDGHVVLTENRTLFPTTVVDVNESFGDRLLVSGHNSRKLGSTIAKGRFKEYALYSLTLEERATCPQSCDVRSVCYGNGMQLARRHRIGDLDLFAKKLEAEIVSILSGVPGLMVLLHVLGDFPSTEYVGMWKDLLYDHRKLAAFGYTHWLPWPSVDDKGAIGNAIEAVKTEFPDRFRIRWSTKYRMRDGAMVLPYIPEKPKVHEGIVCPAQTDATACCASCGLCWESQEPIAFVKHGRASVTAAAEDAMTEATTPRPTERIELAAPSKEPPASPVSARQFAKEIVATHGVEAVREAMAELPSPSDNTRPIVPLQLPSRLTPALILTKPPEVRTIQPHMLRVEPAYQRDLSGKSIKLIRKIVAEWDWAKMKPPICVQTSQGLVVIDGQHTAIAAASHPNIEYIPVMVVKASAIQDRAGAFVAHNRDRLTMSSFQIIHAEAVHGDATAMEIFRIVEDCGAFIPRAASVKAKAKIGEIVSASALQRIFKTHGEAVLRRAVSIAVAASCQPITTTVLYSLQILLTHDLFVSCQKMRNSQMADALHGVADFEKAALAKGLELGINRYSAGARLIAEKAAEYASARIAAQ